MNLDEPGNPYHVIDITRRCMAPHPGGWGVDHMAVRSWDGQREEHLMPSPYKLDIQDDCTACTLPKSGLFCNLSQTTLAALDEITFTSVYPKGSVLFVEGEQPRGVFVLCSGRAKLTTSSSEGKTLILKLIEPGEILGASASILGKPYEVSAETLEPSQVNFIKRDAFLRFLGAHAEACMNTAQQLSEKYHSAQREIRSLGLSQSTSEKLARLILDWSVRGETTAAGVRHRRSAPARRRSAANPTSRRAATTISRIAREADAVPAAVA